MEKQVSEGSLHKWFKGSKSKDGKGGWVNVVTGGTCASDEPGEGTPKCVSSAKRASMTKAERLSAARRKKKADPGQQQKSGAAKPTYVSTDSPRKKKKKKMNEGWSDKYKQSIDCDNPKGFSQKAHCQGKKKMKETYERSLVPLSEKAKKCWPGYEKKGTKKMFGKTYNNCVKKEEVEHEVNEGVGAIPMVAGGIGKALGAAAAGVGAAGMMMQSKKKVNPMDFGKSKRTAAEKAAAREQDKINKGNLPDGAPKSASRVDQGKANVGSKTVSIGDEPDTPSKPSKPDKKSKGFGEEYSEGEIISEVKDKKGKGSGTKDACYHKVKSRYSVWPSAYASGALVKCRKVGAANWGNSSKKEAFSDWKSEFIWEDGDSSKKIDEGKGYLAKKVAGTAFNAALKNPTVRQNVKAGLFGAGAIGAHAPFALPFIPKKKNKKSVDEGVMDTVKDVGKKVIKKTKEFINKPIIRDYPTKKEYEDSVKSGTSSKYESIEYEKSNWRDDLGEDWQKTNRQDKTDGMSQKAVNAYRRENPGSKLKTAVTKKPSSLKRGSKDAKRRKSFCSRMKGMKKRLTSAKTARDPDSRINKALRRWNC